MRFLLALLILVCAATVSKADYFVPSTPLTPTTTGSTVPHSALVIGTDNSYMIDRPFRYTDSASVCAAWGSGSNQCKIATSAFVGLSTASDAQLAFVRDPYAYEPRAALYSGPIPNTTDELNLIKQITAGSLNFSTAYATYSPTGINLSSVATLTGQGATSLASALQIAINTYITGLSPIASFTGTITQKSCTLSGYATGAWIQVTNIGTCPKVYRGMGVGTSFIQKQMAGSDGTPCRGTGVPATCNGTTGLYGTFLGIGPTGTSFLAPGTLPTAYYGVLTFSGLTGTIAPGDTWVLGAGLTNASTPIATADPTTITDTGVGGDAGGFIAASIALQTTGYATVGPEAMTISHGGIEVSLAFPTGVPRLYIVRDENALSNEPLQSTMTLATSNGTGITDNLANVLGLSLAGGGYASSPGQYANSNDNCAWLNHFTTSVMTDFVYMYDYSTNGWNLPVGENNSFATCASLTGTRYQWQPWNSGGVAQPLTPTSPPMYSAFIAAGGNTAPLPANTAYKYGLSTGGYAGGYNAGFSNVAEPPGMDVVYSNVAVYWPTAPGSATSYWAVGLTRTAQGGSPVDLLAPTEAMPTVLLSGASGFPKSQLQDGLTVQSGGTAGPSVGANALDTVAVTYEPFPFSSVTSATWTGSGGSPNGLTINFNAATTMLGPPSGSFVLTISGGTGSSPNGTYTVGTGGVTSTASQVFIPVGTLIGGGYTGSGTTSASMTWNSTPANPATPPEISAIMQSQNCTCGVLQGGNTTALSTTGVTQYLPVGTSSAPQTAANELVAAALVPAPANVEAMSVLLSAFPAQVSSVTSGSGTTPITLNFATMTVAPTGNFTVAGITGFSGCNPNASYTVGSGGTTSTATSVTFSCAGQVGTLVFTSATVTWTSASEVFTLRHAGASVAAWTFTATPGGSLALSVCAIATTGCTSPTMTPVLLSTPTATTVDTIDIQVVPTDIVTAPSVFSSIMYAWTPSTACPTPCSFLAGSGTGLASAANQFFSGVGISAANASEVTTMLLPSLDGYSPVHPSAFVGKITNLTAALISTASQTTRTINFQDWAAPSYASSTAATTAGHCTFAAATGSGYGGTTTNAYVCNNTTDTWTFGSRDLFDILTTSGSATSSSPFRWAATLSLQ